MKISVKLPNVLVSWTDNLRPSFNNGGVAGRIYNSDATPSGADFPIVDAPGAQIFPHIIYIQAKHQYFAIWEDNRNDENPGIYWRDAANLDIYAAWLNDSGQPAGADIPVCTDEGNQRYSQVSYSPDLDRFLIVWQDIVEETVPDVDGEGHVTQSGGNLYGAIYGRKPTLIRLSSFTAAAKSGKVLLKWMTGTETDNAGFNLYRAECAGGAYIKLNDALIAAQGAPAQGASYKYVDEQVQNRKSYYYKLEDIDIRGKSTMHGPVEAKPRVIFDMK